MDIAILVASFAVAIVLFLLLRNEIRLVRNNKRVKDFQSYAAVLMFHMEKAYDIIYKDRILIWSIEATKFDDEEYKNTAKDFAKLVLQLLGPTLIEELTLLYGNEETLLLNITEYFNTRFDDDEIRETAQNNLMEHGIES